MQSKTRNLPANGSGNLRAVDARRLDPGEAGFSSEGSHCCIGRVGVETCCVCGRGRREEVSLGRRFVELRKGRNSKSLKNRFAKQKGGQSRLLKVKRMVESQKEEGWKDPDLDGLF